MKNTAFLSAAAIALMATPALAEGSYVDATYQSEDFSGTDVESFSVGGALALGGNLQLDARYGDLDQDGLGADAWNLGGHLFSRGSQWLWGGYVGYTEFDSTPQWTGAAETQFYMERTTFSGTLAYSDIDSGDLNVWALDGEARHFITDNFSIQANAGFASADTGSSEFDLLTAGVGAELQLASLPISLYGGFQHTEISDGGPEGDTLGIGVRWNFGDGTLLDRNRQGASLARPAGYFERIYPMSPR